jgi:CBS domain-containing protein
MMEVDMNIASLLAKKGPKVVTIGPQATIRQGLAVLAQHNIGALVVLDGAERLVGIVSERDVVRALARSETILAEPLATIMTRDVVIGTPQDDLITVGNTMTERRIRHLPVLETGRLVGIVSIGDVVKAQRDQYQGEVDTLQFQLLQEQDVKAGGTT